MRFLHKYQEPIVLFNAWKSVRYRTDTLFGYKSAMDSDPGRKIKKWSTNTKKFRYARSFWRFYHLSPSLRSEKSCIAILGLCYVYGKHMKHSHWFTLGTKIKRRLFESRLSDYKKVNIFPKCAIFHFLVTFYPFYNLINLWTGRTFEFTVWNITSKFRRRGSEGFKRIIPVFNSLF
jgi:hypothetical protein